MGLTNDDMVIVNGVQYRPEDVPGKSKARTSGGDEVPTGPVTPDDMVIVNGVQYRPEDVPKGAKVEDGKSATSRRTSTRAARKTAASTPTPEAPTKGAEGDGNDATVADEKAAATSDEAPTKGEDEDGDGPDEKAAAVTTKVAQPHNKARTPRKKS